MNDYNENVRLLIKVATELISVADKGQAECVDENCMSLYGLAKDTGYRIRNAAEREYVAHEAKYLNGEVNGGR
jgi:hypothetical protein